MQELVDRSSAYAARDVYLSRSGGKRVVTEDAEWEEKLKVGVVQYLLGGRMEEVHLPVVGTLVGVVVVVVVCQLRTGRRLTEAQSG